MCLTPIIKIRDNRAGWPSGILALYNLEALKYQRVEEKNITLASLPKDMNIKIKKSFTWSIYYLSNHFTGSQKNIYTLKRQMSEYQTMILTHFFIRKMVTPNHKTIKDNKEIAWKSAAIFNQASTPSSNALICLIVFLLTPTMPDLLPGPLGH